MPLAASLAACVSVPLARVASGDCVERAQCTARADTTRLASLPLPFCALLPSRRYTHEQGSTLPSSHPPTL
eukprot:6212788-Pleurochrysis_carterae.AAC.2